LRRYRSGLITFVVTLASGAVALASPPNVPVAPAGVLPEGIHVAYGSDPQTQATISWQTGGSVDVDSAAERVAVAEVTGPDAVTRTVEGWTDGYAEYPVVLAHHVALTGLRPNAAYQYRVAGDGTVWSDRFTFRTAAAGARPFRVAAVGDMGSDTSAPIGKALEHAEYSTTPEATDVPPAAGKTLARMIASDPEMVVFLGDVAYATEVQPEWDEWFRFWEPLGARVPTMFASGNHEHEDGPWADHGFFTRVALPGNERNFSYDYQGVHFVVLDTERTKDAGQRAWLTADLSAARANPETPWIIVYFHKAPYGTGGHRSNGDVRHLWTPLFDQYGVDLVLAGHNHNYERTYPVAYNELVVDTAANDYTDPGAPIYVVSGGGGISMEGAWDAQPAWSAVRYLTHQFTTLDIDPAHSITVTSIASADGAMLDRFTLRKDVCGAASPPSWC
jgi:acid phosphatase type 7